jgi:hypothetical protein
MLSVFVVIGSFSGEICALNQISPLSPGLVVAEERIILEVFVGCHGRNDEEALEGERSQVDSGASLLEAFEIDESGYAATWATTADF